MQTSITTVGKEIRMNRIFKEDGKALMVAINHGLGMGPIQGIEDPGKLIRDLANSPIDSLTLHKGLAKRFANEYAGKCALVLKGTNVTKYYKPAETPIASVEEAVAAGADCIALGLSLGTENEEEVVTSIAQMIEVADRYGMPVTTHSYPNGPLIPDAERYNVEYVSYATRMALELGVDIIKTFWTGSGSSFEKIVKVGSPAKVVISGGAKCNTLRECFEMTYEGIAAGAAGVTYGRNIWQHEYPIAVINGLAAIIHDNESVDHALDIASEIAGVKLL